MKVNIDYIIKQVEMVDLVKAQKVEQVHGYCKNCSNYQKNHSCPDFDFDPKGYVKDYKYATLIMTVIEAGDIQPHLEEIKSKTYESRVYDNYNKENLSHEDQWSSMFSMYVFNTVKDDMTQRLLKFEDGLKGSVSLPPGSCTACKTCLKKLGKPCVNEKDLRYSLEALGFLVSDIYKFHFDLEMTWSDGDLPDAFRSISGILSNDLIGLKDVEKMLESMSLEV